MPPKRRTKGNRAGAGEAAAPPSLPAFPSPLLPTSTFSSASPITATPFTNHDAALAIDPTLLGLGNAFTSQPDPHASAEAASALSADEMASLTELADLAAGKTAQRAVGESFLMDLFGLTQDC